MGGSEPNKFELPNAFLASSSPGHPFWTHYVQDIEKHWEAGDIDTNSVETVTGPVALFRSAQTWQDTSESKVQILPTDKIYPFSWNSNKHGERCVCLADRQPEFDAQRCSMLFPQAWTITCGRLDSIPICCHTLTLRQLVRWEIGLDVAGEVQ